MWLFILGYFIGVMLTVILCALAVTDDIEYEEKEEEIDIYG